MTQYQRVGDVEAAPMQDEVVIYHPGQKRFCVLNPTAAFIWDQLSAPKTVQDLADGMAEAFDEVDQNRVVQDIEAAVQELLDLELIATL